MTQDITRFEGVYTIPQNYYAEGEILFKVFTGGVEYDEISTVDIIAATLGRIMNKVQDAEGFCVNLNQQDMVKWINEQQLPGSLYYGTIENYEGQETLNLHHLIVKVVCPKDNVKTLLDDLGGIEDGKDEILYHGSNDEDGWDLTELFRNNIEWEGLRITNSALSDFGKILEAPNSKSETDLADNVVDDLLDDENE